MNLRERLRELWHYRELIRNLVSRDLKARYKNSILGIAWSWINPLLMMLVYTVVFTILASRSGPPNYPVFILCALLPWQLFQTSAAIATNSVVDAAGLIKKVYFPREIIPISVVLSGLVNFLISLPVFFLIALIMGTPITAAVLLLPITILIQVAFTLGVGLITSTLNVFYRDTRIIMEVLLNAWFFLTPIFYPISSVPEEYTFQGVALNLQRLLRWINPMASIVASYRDLLYYGVPTGLDFLLRTAATSFVILVVGYFTFIRFSGRFGEEV